MRLSVAMPITALREHVRAFEQREADLEGPVIFPLAARPEQFLEFYLLGEYRIKPCASDALDAAPRAAAVGPSTHRRAGLLLSNRLSVFTIQFQPAGFHRLFRVPMPELTDRGLEARSILGPAFSELQEKLAGAPDFGARVEIATGFLVWGFWCQVKSVCAGSFYNSGMP